MFSTKLELAQCGVSSTVVENVYGISVQKMIKDSIFFLQTNAGNVLSIH